MILVDTSVLIDFFKGARNKPADRFRTVLREKIPFGITPFILQEVLQGAKNDVSYKMLKKYLETQRFYHPKDPVGSYADAARIYFVCRRRGITIRSTIDCLIAQTAMEHDLSLLHNDKDFDAMKEAIKLKVY